MTGRHYHLTARDRAGHRRLLAEARSAELAWRWHDRWAPDFARRGEILTVQVVEGDARACAGRMGPTAQREGTHE